MGIGQNIIFWNQSATVNNCDHILIILQYNTYISSQLVSTKTLATFMTAMYGLYIITDVFWITWFEINMVGDIITVFTVGWYENGLSIQITIVQ